MENESQSNIDNDYIISDKDIWDAQCGNGKVMKKIGDALWAGDDMERNKEQALFGMKKRQHGTTYPIILS